MEAFVLRVVSTLLVAAVMAVAMTGVLLLVRKIQLALGVKDDKAVERASVAKF